MDRVTGKAFADRAIDITGKSWVGCVFTDCDVTFTATPDAYTEIGDGCHFDGCTFYGDGWPQEVRDAVISSKGGSQRFPRVDNRN